MKGIVQSMGTYARTRKELLVSLQRCREEKKERDENGQKTRDELEQAKAALDEQDLIFKTIQFAVTNEKTRLAHLEKRYERVQEEYLNLSHAIKSNQDNFGRKVAGPLMRQQAHKQKTLRTHMSLTVSQNDTTSSKKQETLNEARTERPGRKLASVTRPSSNKMVQSTARMSKSQNQYTDIFGGKRHQNKN